MRKSILVLSMIWAFTGVALALTSPSRTVFTPIAAPSAPVQFGQVFYRGAFDPNLMCGTRGMLWSTNLGAVSCTYTLRYAPAYRVYFDPTSSTLFCSLTSCINWLYANHPDWIEYLNDQTTIAWEFGNLKYPPLDIANPDVQAFFVQQDLLHALPTGFRGIGIDNLSAQNSFLMAGHYTGTTAPCVLADQPACHGTWVQQYGGVSSTDVRWQIANLAYVNYLRQSFSQYGLTTFANLSYQLEGTHIAVNDALNGSMAEDWTQHSCDTTANNYLNGFVIDQLWKNAYFNSYHDMKGWWFGLNYLCGHDTDGMTHAEESYGIANFLLASQNPAQNYISLALSGSDDFANYPASANPPIGTPTQLPPTPGSCGGTGVGTDNGICTRTYSNGMVAVNSSASNTRSFTLGAGDWVDQFCTPVAAGSVSMAPATGLVIVAHPNAQCP